MASRAIPILVCGVVLLTALVVNQSAVHWRSNIVDDHLFAYYGWCTAQGARPYVDFWDNKPPGIWWLNAAAIRLVGPGVESELLLGLLAVGATLAAFVGIARSAYDPSLLLPATLMAAVLLTDQRFECGGNRTETYVLAAECLAVLGYVRWLRTEKTAWLILAGLAAGSAPLLKQSGAGVGLALVLHLAWTQWRRSGAAVRWSRVWLAAGLGAALPAAAAAAVLAGQGALGEAVFAVGRFNRAYFEIHDATWWRLGDALGVFEPALTPLTGVFLAAGAGVVLWLSGQRAIRREGEVGAGTGTAQRELRPPGAWVGLFLLWFLLDAYLACVGPGRRGHHFMPALAPLGLLALYLLHWLAMRPLRGGATAGQSVAGLAARLAARPGAVVALVVWLYVLLDLQLGSLAEADRSWHTRPSWCALDRDPPAPYEAQAAAIRGLTEPDDRIYVWGWSPGTYRYALRRPASRFATLEKCGQVGVHAQFIVDGAMADLRRSPPRVFAISTGDHDAMLAAPRSAFAEWLTARYDVAAQVEGLRILLRHHGPPR